MQSVYVYLLLNLSLFDLVFLIQLDESPFHVLMFHSDVPVYCLGVLATHVAVWTLEAWQIDALQPVMTAHTARSVENARALRTWKTAPVQGGLKFEQVPGVSRGMLLQNDRPKVCKQKQRKEGRILKQRCAQPFFLTETIREKQQIENKLVRKNLDTFFSGAIEGCFDLVPYTSKKRSRPKSYATVFCVSSELFNITS